MRSDQFAVRAVITGLLISLVLLIGGIIYLATTQTPIPDVLSQLALANMTGVLGLLATTSTSRGSQPVVVTNDSANAVPVDNQPPIDGP